jgi:F-type H+-transporting ATPase subunit epsilon
MAKLLLEIVTPECRAYSAEVDSVVLSGIDGELGILPMHIPLMTRMLPGELRVHHDGHEVFLAVGEGFIEVTQEKVSVLTDMAIKEADIDESVVEEAIKRAEISAMDEKLGAEELATVQATLQKSLAQLKVKRRRHS